jgi:hypothetical protein
MEFSYGLKLPGEEKTSDLAVSGVQILLRRHVSPRDVFRGSHCLI